MRRLLLSLLVSVVPAIAFAQDSPGKADPVPAPASPVASPPPVEKASDKPSEKGGAPAAPHVEGEGDEEHATPAPPTPKAPPVVRMPVVVKEGMARIPGGRFTMGTDDRKAPPNERPSHAVVVPAFWIDKTEITVGAYRACVDRGACSRPARSSSSCTYDVGDPQLPVNCISWVNAQAYCVAVSKRLPREAEWEFAARGTSPIKYPWGGGGAAGCGVAVTLATDASQRSCGPKNRPARVGSHVGGASPFGLYDMSGNVEEWVADWYIESVSDLSPRAGASHVLRGGGWLSRPSDAKTTSRNWGSAREMGPNVGFRCAKDD